MPLPSALTKIIGLRPVVVNGPLTIAAILLTNSQPNDKAMAVPALKPPAAEPSRSFHFHGRTFLAFVLKPDMPIGRWLTKADTWLSRSPGFFAGKPVVVDVSRLLLTKAKLAKLIGDLGSRGVRVMGLLGADPAWVDRGLLSKLFGRRAA